MIQEYLLVMHGLFENTEPYIETVEEAYDRIFRCKSQADDIKKLNLYLKTQIQDFKLKQEIKVKVSKESKEKESKESKDKENNEYSQNNDKTDTTSPFNLLNSSSNNNTNEEKEEDYFNFIKRIFPKIRVK